jgi:hypothetical protein
MKRILISVFFLSCLIARAQQSNPVVKQTPYSSGSPGVTIPTPTVSNLNCTINDNVNTYIIPCASLISITLQGTTPITINGDNSPHSGVSFLAACPTCGTGNSAYPYTGFTAVSVAGWTWQNQGTSTRAVNNGVLVINGQGTSGSNGVRLFGTTLPATPWTIIAAMLPIPTPGLSGPGQTNLQDGPCLSDGTKYTMFSVFNGTTYPNGLIVDNFSTSSSHTSSLYSNTTISMWGPVLWEKIVDNGTTRTYSVSADPTNIGWFQIASESHAGFLTPTVYGYCFNGSGATGVYPSRPLVSIQVTTP